MRQKQLHPLNIFGKFADAVRSNRAYSNTAQAVRIAFIHTYSKYETTRQWQNSIFPQNFTANHRGTEIEIGRSKAERPKDPYDISMLRNPLNFGVAVLRSLRYTTNSAIDRNVKNTTAASILKGITGAIPFALEAAAFPFTQMPKILFGIARDKKEYAYFKSLSVSGPEINEIERRYPQVEKWYNDIRRKSPEKLEKIVEQENKRMVEVRLKDTSENKRVSLAEIDTPFSKEDTTRRSSYATILSQSHVDLNASREHLAQEAAPKNVSPKQQDAPRQTTQISSEDQDREAHESSISKSL